MYYYNPNNINKYKHIYLIIELTLCINMTIKNIKISTHHLHSLILAFY